MEIRLSCINYIREEKEFFKTFIFNELFEDYKVEHIYLQ